MKTATASLRAALAIGGLGLLIAPVANAQTTLSLDLPEAKMPEVKVTTRTPIQTDPKAILDPYTGKPVSPKAVITLQDGRKITAGDLHDQLADSEAALNKLGYSLYDPNSPTMMITPILDLDLMRKQSDTLFQEHQAVPNAPKAQAAHENMLVKQNDYMAQFFQKGGTEVALTGQMQAVLDTFHPSTWELALDPEPPVNTGNGRVFDRYYNYYKQLGDASTFMAYLSGSVHLYGGSNELGFQATGQAGGAVFGHYAALLNAYGDGRSYQGTISGQVSLDVLGYSMLNTTYNQPVYFSDDRHWSVEVAEPYHVWIGPLPIGGRVGIRGSVGLRYGGGLYGGNLCGTINPYANVSGFAEVGIDVWFASAGVGGELTFLKDDLNLTAAIYLSSTNGQPSLKATASCYNDITSLSGRFYLWAKLFGFRGEYDLFNWSGFTSRGYVFSGSNNVIL